jgi:hypothetical protein
MPRDRAVPKTVLGFKLRGAGGLPLARFFQEKSDRVPFRVSVIPFLYADAAKPLRKYSVMIFGL